ncbi:spore protease YyaC [Lederbergia citrea]|uniref:spore protease YyaC n=1 Tax=Lederbergia citrea TaxID=2833581 RepID=UPI001BCA3573|nr:spore protease YyaC [Lederbergia citrea]MBS4177615.1 spore protease YyaC [Lederbergia citrea]
MMPPKEHEEVKVNYDDLAATKKISNGMIDFLPLGSHRPIIVVCIGTDRSTGDSLGPLIGTFLQETGLECFHLYGTLEDPVHAVNLNEKLDVIYKNHTDPYVIGIDACLGKFKNIGVVKIDSGPLKPGAGVKKELPEVGHMHITGVVNVSGYMEFFVLQNTRLNLVMKMAKQIAAGISEADKMYARKHMFRQLEWDINQERNVE